MITTASHMSDSTTQKEMDQMAISHHKNEEVKGGGETMISEYRPLLCSVEEAAALLGISRTAVFRLIKESQLRSVKIQKRRLIPLAALDEFVSELLEAS